MRPFGSIEELARRVPSLSQADLIMLAETGALNSLCKRVYRRDALWQVSLPVSRTDACRVGARRGGCFAAALLH